MEAIRNFLEKGSSSSSLPNIHSSVQKAYNRHANRYDNLQSTGGWVRQQLWTEYRRLFHPGDHILDLGCGTGIDSIYLARQLNCHVTAVDISSNMLQKLKEKAASLQLPDRITTVRAPMEQLPNKSFASPDGVVSAFASINTVDDYAALTRFLSDQLPSGAAVLFHGLNQPGKLKMPFVHRTLKSSYTTTEKHYRESVDIENVKVPHQLLDPVRFYGEYFKKDFKLDKVYGIGWLAPTSINNEDPPLPGKVLRKIDLTIGSYKLFRKASRYFILIMEKL